MVPATKIEITEMGILHTAKETSDVDLANVASLGSHPRIELVPITKIAPFSANARTHSRKQIRQIANSIERFGFNNPVLLDDGGGIIAGHGRLAAAKLLGRKDVPALRLTHLSALEKRAYILADNSCRKGRLGSRNPGN